MPILERETILDGLDVLLGRAAWDGGRVVLVRGEAGIGKSTLVKAFADGRRDKVLWGMCDPVALPQPLGPILDMAERDSGDLTRALQSGDRHRVSSAFLGLLRASGGPWLAVIEDAQWADDATLELLKVVGRRIQQCPALLVLTLRDEEVGPRHPLSLVLGDLPPSSVVSVSLPPLSLSAVQQLTAGTGVDPVALHAAAAGNPFFVTEVLASGGTDLPVTVRDAIIARAGRLPPEAFLVLQAAAVLGQRCDPDVLVRVSGATPAALAECVDHRLLHQDGAVLEFSHELAQRAILDSLTASDRIALHGRALSVLSERPAAADAAELANHAVGAGDAVAVLELAPHAANLASALGAHRTALKFYDCASRYAGRLAPGDRAPLLTGHALECYVTDDVDRALSLQKEAVACWQESGDVDRVAEAMVAQALYEYWIGEAASALTTAERAMGLLESRPPGPGLARAYARLAQILLVTGRLHEAVTWGEKAVGLAERHHNEPVVVHALNTIGTSESYLGGEAGFEKIEESLRRACAAELEDDVARAYNNLLADARENRRYDRFDRYVTDAIRFAAERDLDLTRRCLVGDVAEAALNRGRLDEAYERARTVLENGEIGVKFLCFQCLWVLGLVTARRGEPECWQWLDHALDEAGSDFGAALVCPIWAARAEAAWLERDLRRAAVEVRHGLAALSQDASGWVVGGIAYWAWKLDPDFEPPSGMAEPYALHMSGHPRKAAAAWADLGCPYEEALALADSDDQDDVRRALDIFLDLGTTPAASIAAAKLKVMGARRISRGPRASTRANPSGLSAREMEVLQLVVEGLRNAEIAQRLVISPKTVDHHVSSLLAKLGARDRHDAAKKAAELGIAT